MDAKVTPPDFSEMCHEIEAAGQRAMHPVGDDEKSTVLFEYALNEVMGIRATAIAAGISFKRNKEIGHKAHQVRELAEWELGHLLRAMDEADLRDKGYATKGRKAGAPTDLPTLEQLGIARHDSRKWQRKARIPKEEFLASIATAKPKSQRRGPRMMGYALHPITDEYADFTPDELEALRLSLREHGRLVVPIVIWRNQTVDGKHRTKICREEGIPLRYDDISERCSTEEEMRAYVRALNEHRRANTKPLKAVERRALIEGQLRKTPAKPDRQIAEGLGVDHKTVGAVREGLEGRGEIPHVETRRDTKGRKQPARKTKRQSNAKRKPFTAKDAPHDVDQPGLPFQPALVPERAPAPGSQEPTSFEDDAAPSSGPSEPAPRPDPYAIHRAAVRGSIRGLVNIRDVDFGPVADAMPIEQLREARNESDEAAETKRKWDAAVDVAIARHAAP